MSASSVSTITAIEILSLLISRGVAISTKGDKLSLKPLAAFDDLVEAIAERKAELLALIESLPRDKNNLPLLPPVLQQFPDLTLGEDGLWRRGNFIVPTAGTMTAYSRYYASRRKTERSI